MIQYGRHNIEKDDIDNVIKVLKSDFLTTGPKIMEFEKKFSKFVNARYAVAVSNGTAALHLACLSIGIKKGDEVITSPITFAATSNSILYCNAKPIFSDIDEKGTIDVNKIEENITENTKAIIPVHYSGIPCDMGGISKIAKKYNLKVIEDACHALGSNYNNIKIGSCKHSDISIFSFHPVKNITTGEGGMITTNSKQIYKKLILLRSHGITKEKNLLINKNEGPWHQEMHLLGFNYRITDFQCALGISQLEKVEEFIKKRRKIAKKYDDAFKNENDIETIKINESSFNSFHLYVIKLKNKKIRYDLFDYLKIKNINCQVHYLPVYQHPYYRKIGYKNNLCQKAEEFYDRIISLPIYPSLGNDEQNKVIEEIKKFTKNLNKEKNEYNE